MKSKAIIFLIVFIGVLSAFAFKKNQKEDRLKNKGIHPYYSIIKHERKLSGYIEPMKEIHLKPQISGVIEKIYIRPGHHVKVGDLVATLKVIIDPLSLEDAENRMRLVKDNYNLAKADLERNKKLFQAGAISESTFQKIENEEKKYRQELYSIKRKIQLIKKGHIDGEKQVSNHVYSTISGVVLDIPFKEGSYVIETNTFNEGSTIATVADMNKMLFKGLISENDIQYLKEGMHFPIFIGATGNQVFDAILTYISPKGKLINGISKFEFEALIQYEQNQKLVIRSGYSAIANILIEETDSVLAIKEEMLFFDEKDQTFVYLNIEGEKEKRYVEVGVSNGIEIEIKNGLTETSLLRL
ncbi:efflux RND transporter periplasmic adaptor subunit [Flammeovirga kamogawensis]|uniref:Efflux RND transporter periplasmic adaptor subunit n=1 Tax=Flammeovirga kamogawensis TaxID=373891 RepID=A0ABX8H1H1_9BACT|nr:efflux RND transporter periplasmic adaptor subunit [Flammeovirga kamogawensis]MBB6463663.1 HlyD family secretion protein [Flammeovirga kamogawensis]QWG09276.1 efflux RND transporter periplasmic adaptor subunit [Flammeovirga kamogawensis]TRX64800.1 efflux RND transporter periplasmic adaptor subunit [Flammeovirga kamogawensis]